MCTGNVDDNAPLKSRGKIDSSVGMKICMCVGYDYIKVWETKMLTVIWYA